MVYIFHNIYKIFLLFLSFNTKNIVLGNPGVYKLILVLKSFGMIIFF